MRWIKPLAWLVPFCLFALGTKAVSGRISVKSQALRDRGEKSILCDDKRPQLVHVSYGRVTVINFPFKPKDVIPGEPSFDFKQIRNDLVLKALRPQSKTNLLVYLEDRRCAFDLVTVVGRGDDVLIVRDAKDNQMEVNFYE